MQGEFYVGGQEQFYLEGQISYAVPKEDGCLHLYCSTQHPTEMQHVVAHALDLVANQVTVEMRRMGGGFGGKESQSALFACVAAVAAQRLRVPVKIRLDRDDDFLATGKRHCFHYDYEVGYDDDGVIRAAKIEMTARAGFSADLSGPVCTRAVCHFDNAYYLPDVDILALAGKTNTQSNTAFRGFGGPQGAIAIEYLIDNIARELGRDPLDVRKANFYGTDERNVTPYGMTVEDNVIHELVAELEASSDYRQRRGEIRAFNAASPVLKKGLALTPVKFGISFNVVHYNQAGALVHVYTDGSVLVSHGGTEMGQGLNTKVAQVVAHELGIGLAARALDRRRHEQGREHVGHRGVDGQRPERQGGAGRRAADQGCGSPQFAAGTLRRPRRGRGVRRRRGHASTAARSPFAGARAAGLPRRASSSGPTASTRRRSCTGTGSTMSGRPFFYFAYGAAVSEVDRRHADRRVQAAARRPAARRRRLDQSGDRHRAGRGRLHPGHGLAHDRGAVVERGRRADDARAVDVQDPGGQRLPGRLPDEALREQQRRGHDPALEGDRRAAAAAAVLGVLRDPRRDRERGRLPDQSAARRAGDRRGDPQGRRRRARGALSGDAR